MGVRHRHHERLDEELVDLSIRIDRGYIKLSELTNWRDLVRNAFISGTQRRPTPFSSEWGPDRPVIQAFVRDHVGDTYVMRPSFKDRINFYDSAITPAIRIADVLAAILRRGVDRGPPAGVLARLSGYSCRADPYSMLVWTTEVPDAGSNPYDLFRRSTTD